MFGQITQRACDTEGKKEEAGGPGGWQAQSLGEE